MAIILEDPAFAGLTQSINPQAQQAVLQAIDDMEGEQETLPDFDVDSLTEAFSGLQNASKGVSESTDNEYRR